MIKRLDVTSDGQGHDVAWPPLQGRLEDALFSARNRFRRITVMVDNDVLEEARDGMPATPRQLLSALLESHLVRLHRYADDGPSSDVQPMPGSPGAYEGWAVVVNDELSAAIPGVIFSTSDSSASLGGVDGNACDVAEADSGNEAYRDLEPRGAAMRRRADVLAAQVAAQVLRADVYVTERPYLHTCRWNPARGTTVCDVAEALALIGLYFRSQDEYPVARRYSLNRGLFFWVGTRELLPEAWRWFSACVQHSAGAKDESLMLLGASLLQRVDRALQARDATHLALDQPQGNDQQQEALSQLDVVLFNLMSAADITARVAHRVVGLPGGDRKAGWQYASPGHWLDKLGNAEPRFAGIVGPGSRAESALTILRLLRNSVHGAALQGLAVISPGGPRETLVGLPSADEKRILAAIDLLGGQGRWGIRDTRPGRVHLDPGVLVDTLFEEVIALLNMLMAATPVERLPSVRLTPSDLNPPEGANLRSLLGLPWPRDPFEPWIRASIRWQLGF